MYNLIYKNSKNKAKIKLEVFTLHFGDGYEYNAIEYFTDVKSILDYLINNIQNKTEKKFQATLTDIYKNYQNIIKTDNIQELETILNNNLGEYDTYSIYKSKIKVF